MSSASAGKAKASPPTQQFTLDADGASWKLTKKPGTPKQPGTTMTLRRSHSAKMDRSPTVFPSAKMSTFKDAPSAQKRKILDEADKISQEERAKLAKRTPSRGGGSTSNDKPDDVDSPPLAHHGNKRTDSEKKRGRARTKRQVASGSAEFMKEVPSPVPDYIA